jgi:uncharacterized delta-60 repeat protein
MAVGPDGSIFITGNLLVDPKSRKRRTGLFSVQKFNSDGRPDPTFASNGESLVKPNTGGAGIIPRYLHLMPDGGVISGGLAGYMAFVPMVNKYKSDGSFDPDFGKRVKKQADVPGYAYDATPGGPACLSLGLTDFNETGPFAHLIAGRGGQFFFAGRSPVQTGKKRRPEETWLPVIRKFTAEGLLDRSFGKAGTVQLQRSDNLFDFTVLDDGRSAILMNQQDHDSGVQGGLLVKRLLESGKVDSTWRGVDLSPLIAKSVMAFLKSTDGVDVQISSRVINHAQFIGARDGGVFVGGESEGYVFVIRVSASGEIDESWGQQGIVLWRESQYAWRESKSFAAFALMPRGEIVAYDNNDIFSLIDPAGRKRESGPIEVGSGGYMPGGLQIVPQGENSLILLGGFDRGDDVRLDRIRLDATCPQQKNP